MIKLLKWFDYPGVKGPKRWYSCWLWCLFLLISWDEQPDESYAQSLRFCSFVDFKPSSVTFSLHRLCVWPVLFLHALFCLLTSFCLTFVLCLLFCVLWTLLIATAPKRLRSPQMPQPSPLHTTSLSSSAPPVQTTHINTFSSSSVFFFPSPPSSPPVYLLPVAPVLPHFFTLPYSPPLPSSPQSPFSCPSFFSPHFPPSALYKPLPPLSSSLPTLHLLPSPHSASPTSASSPRTLSATVPSSPSPSLICASSPPLLPPSSTPPPCPCSSSSSPPQNRHSPPPPSPPSSPLPTGVPPYFRRDRSVPEVYI